VTFGILVVCTGNICRSPIAERLLVAGIQQRLGAGARAFEVSSAGTWGHSDAAMEPAAAATVRELGGEPGGFRARELTSAHIAAADLVLTATREHRAAVVTMVPRASGRTFTLREFARLTAGVEASELPGLPEERARALVGLAAGRRGIPPLPAPGEDDVADPYGATAPAYRAVGRLVMAAIAGPLDLIAGPT